MQYAAQYDTSKRKHFPGATSDPCFEDGESPIPGVYAMRNLFTAAEYPEPGVHDDHEGFYVVSGRGWLLIADQEYELTPGTAMFAPAKTPHAIKSSGGELEIFIYHFPVQEV